MKSEELRGLQAPLKQQYRDDPDSGILTLRAEGALAADVTCVVKAWKTDVEAGLHPASGGDGRSACPTDMLLQALAGCAGVTLGAVSTSLGIEIRGGTIRAEGDLDFRGTLGVSKEVPVGLQRIRLTLELDTDATEEQLATLAKLTERYCVVYQTLRQSPSSEVICRATPKL